LPTSGSVKVGGVDVVESPDAVKAKVGYLPDRPPLYEDLSVSDYLTFAARIRGAEKSQVGKLVAEAIELTELGDVSKKIIGALSHGYKQRVGIAQAIVHAPELVVLDEPISGLDPVQIVEMRELVKNLKGEHTVVLSSHILSEISETCDRILVINSGKIAWSGTESALSAELRQGASPEPERTRLRPKRWKLPKRSRESRRSRRAPRAKSAPTSRPSACEARATCATACAAPWFRQT